MPLSLCLALSLGLGFGVLEFTKPLNPKLGFRVLGFRVSLSLSRSLYGFRDTSVFRGLCSQGVLAPERVNLNQKS